MAFANAIACRADAAEPERPMFASQKMLVEGEGVSSNGFSDFFYGKPCQSTDVSRWYPSFAVQTMLVEPRGVEPLTS